jgi:hypothetical protein
MIERSPPVSPIRLFISYAHADATHLVELKKRLKALHRVHTQLAVWDDTQLIGGDKWEEAIVRNLNAADIVCLLVSPDFMNSDYCFAKELPPALAKYAESGGAPGPIIIRETPSWTALHLAEHQALPRGPKPVEDWPSADKFCGAVETGSKAVIERLAAKAPPERLSGSSATK